MPATQTHADGMPEENAPGGRLPQPLYRVRPSQNVIETKRLLLRRFKRTDVDDLLLLNSDPEVRRFVEDGRPVTKEQLLTDIESWLAADEESTIFGFWAVEEKVSGDFIGWFHLLSRDTDETKGCEIGYRLVTASWGRGFGTEGSVALIDEAFQETGTARVVAETMSVHSASRRVMEKAGMRLVRTFQAEWPVRLPGDEDGDVEYAINRSEWEARRQRP